MRIIKSNQGLWRNVVAVVVVVAGLTTVAGIPVAQADGDDRDRPPQVFPLDSTPYGNTYGEWSARWWQWLLSIPDARNPNLDTTGRDCDEGQSGPVWFLAGSFGPKFTRNCTVPAGKALFFSPLNQVSGAGVFDCEPTKPDVPCNLNELRRLAAASQDNPKKLSVTIDDVPLRNLRAFRVQSPVFSLTIPSGAVFGIPSGTYSPHVADGYWVMLAPLSAGKHTVHLKAIPAIPEDGSFEVDVAYDLTVER